MNDPEHSTAPATPSYRSAQFLTSAAKLSQCPADAGWEVAFAGRSNAGKSSAINSLTNNKKLAKTSKTPGRTQLINFFEVSDSQRLVDLTAATPAQQCLSLFRLFALGNFGTHNSGPFSITQENLDTLDIALRGRDQDLVEQVYALSDAFFLVLQDTHTLSVYQHLGAQLSHVPEAFHQHIDPGWLGQQRVELHKASRVAGSRLLEESDR